MTERDYELLSAYLDNQLEADERAALEARLRIDAGLRRELAALRQTVALVKALPPVRAPRDFTLTPEQADVREVTRSRRVATRFAPLIPVLSAVAVVAVMFVGVLALVSLLQPAVGNVFSEVAYSEDAAERRMPVTPTVALLPPAAQAASGNGGLDAEAEAAELSLATGDAGDVVEDAAADTLLFETFEAVPEADDAHTEATLLQQVMPALLGTPTLDQAGTAAAEAPLSAMMAPTDPAAEAGAPPTLQTDLPLDPGLLLPLLRLLLWLVTGG